MCIDSYSECWFSGFSCAYMNYNSIQSIMCPLVQDTCLNMPNYVGFLLISVKNCLRSYSSGDKYVLVN